MAQEKVLDIIKSRKIIESAYGINLNAAQGTAANSLTRRDFVEAQDSLKVSKSGDTMSGNLTVPRVLLSAAQGTEANSVARRDFVESTVTASGKGVKDLTIALPSGAPTTGYIPVLFKTYGTSNSFVFIDTLSSSETHPMNNCSFIGNVRAGGWSDNGSYAVGQFTIYSGSERAIHSIHGPAEAVDGFVVYVETRAFPIRVRVDIETAVTAYATDVTYGTSIFAVNGQVSGNTKTRVLANFDKGSGTYNGSNRVYDTGYNPTPEAVGALPVNGNAVTASRLQTARLIAGVPFDGTSNISISATNVGALPASGNTVASIIDNTTNIGKTVLDYQTITNWAHPVGTSLFLTALSADRPSGNGGYWNTIGRRDSNNGYAGIFVEYSNSSTGVWIGKNEAGEAPIWQRVYTNHYKPTAADVGAVNKTGDSMSGQLSLTPSFVDTSVYAQLAHIGKDATKPLYIRNMREHNSSSWLWEKVYSGSLYYSSGTNGSGTNKIRLQVSGSGEIYLGENADKRVYHEGFKPTPSAIGAVNKTGDTMTGALTAPEFIESSDIRLKSDIRTIDRCLDRVNVITPYTYDKVGQDGYDAGVIAQDVAYALPEAVRDIKVEVEGEEKEMLGVSYSGLTALAIGAIKELHELVKAQQAEITELKSLIK